MCRTGHKSRNMACFQGPHTHRHRHRRARCCWRPRSCGSADSQCCLTSQWPVCRFTLHHVQAKPFWRYLLVDWMFAFRHLVGPSAPTTTSWRVSFYTVAPTVPTDRMPRQWHFVQTFVFLICRFSSKSNTSVVLRCRQLELKSFFGLSLFSKMKNCDSLVVSFFFKIPVNNDI